MLLRAPGALASLSVLAFCALFGRATSSAVTYQHLFLYGPSGFGNVQKIEVTRHFYKAASTGVRAARGGSLAPLPLTAANAQQNWTEVPFNKEDGYFCNLQVVKERGEFSIRLTLNSGVQNERSRTLEPRSESLNAALFDSAATNIKEWKFDHGFPVLFSQLEDVMPMESWHSYEQMLLNPTKGAAARAAGDAAEAKKAMGESILKVRKQLQNSLQVVMFVDWLPRLHVGSRLQFKWSGVGTKHPEQPVAWKHRKIRESRSLFAWFSVPDQGDGKIELRIQGKPKQVAELNYINGAVFVQSSLEVDDGKKKARYCLGNSEIKCPNAYFMVFRHRAKADQTWRVVCDNTVEFWDRSTRAWRRQALARLSRRADKGFLPTEQLEEEAIRVFEEVSDQAVVNATPPQVAVEVGQGESGERDSDAKVIMVVAALPVLLSVVWYTICGRGGATDEGTTSSLYSQDDVGPTVHGPRWPVESVLELPSASLMVTTPGTACPGAPVVG